MIFEISSQGGGLGFQGNACMIDTMIYRLKLYVYYTLSYNNDVICCYTLNFAVLVVLQSGLFPVEWLIFPHHNCEVKLLPCKSDLFKAELCRHAHYQ